MSDERPFGRILLLKRHRRPSGRLLSGVVELARRSEARLTFAHALEGGDQIADLSQQERLRELEGLLRPHLDGFEADYRLLSSSLVEAAERAAGQFDLLVPAEGDEPSEAAERELVRLLRRSPVPVWLDGSSGRAPREILAAVDVQTKNPLKRSLNLPIVRRALLLASRYEARLSLLSVISRPPATELLARRLAGDAVAAMPTRRAARERLQRLLADAQGDDTLVHEPRLMIAQGDSDQLIRQAARSASVDLLVAGCLGRDGLAGWLVGNTTERLSQTLGCSILAITQPHQGSRQPLSSRAA